MPYYAVANGKNPGVYNSWSECESQVKGYPNAKFKKFSTMSEANEFCGVSDNRSRAGASGGGFSSQPSYSCGNSGYSGFIGGPPMSLQSGYGSSSTDSRGHVDVYTDGACTNNGRYGAKAGVGVYWGPDHPDNVSRPLQGKQTNNRAEIQAATEAIRQAQARGYKSVTVHTDSEFLINGVGWSKKWSQNGWKLSTGGPVKNKDDFIALNDAMKSIDVKFKKVPAHSGEHGNEMADRLAFAGAKKG